MIKDKQKFLGLALSYLLSFSALTYFCNTISEELWGKGISWDNALLYGLFVLLIGFAFLRNARSIPLPGAVVCLFFILSYIWTAIAFPQNHQYMWTSFSDFFNNPFYLLFIFSFLALPLLLYLKDTEFFLKSLEIFSVIIIVLASIHFFLGIEDKDEDVAYMTFAYNILLPVTLLLLNSIRKFNIFRLLIGMFGFFLLFIIGCRGALVSCAAVVVLYIFFFGKFNIRTRITITVIAVIGLIALYVCFEDLMYEIQDVLIDIGFNSRTLEYILGNNFLNDSGRSNYYASTLNNVSFFGSGFYGDRLLFHGSYTHNFVFEIIHCYGYLVGLIVLAAMALLVVCAIIKSDERCSLLLCVFLAGFFKLMFSSSFLLQEPAFFALIGLSLAIVCNTINKDCENNDETMVKKPLFDFKIPDQKYRHR